MKSVYLKPELTVMQFQEVLLLSEQQDPWREDIYGEEGI